MSGRAATVRTVTEQPALTVPDEQSIRDELQGKGKDRIEIGIGPFEEILRLPRAGILDLAKSVPQDGSVVLEGLGMALPLEPCRPEPRHRRVE